MSLPILFFASYADAFGARQIESPVPTPCTVEALVEALRVLPGGHVLPKAPLVAVNLELADWQRIITADDEVAIIPPVAGG